MLGCVDLGLTVNVACAGVAVDASVVEMVLLSESSGMDFVWLGSIPVG